MKFPAPPAARKCEARIIQPGSNTADANPDKTTKCREVATRFITEKAQRIAVCQTHFRASFIADDGQVSTVLSRVTPGRGSHGAD
jgi:hypothetical protein